MTNRQFDFSVTLDSVDAESIPSHRVVGANGLLKSTKRRSADAQAELLRAECVTIAPKNAVQRDRCRLRDLAPPRPVEKESPQFRARLRFDTKS